MLLFKDMHYTSAYNTSLAQCRGGLLLLTGAQAALQGTAGMIGYGLAKAAVHQLVSSLGAASSGLPANTSVLAILP